MKRPSTWIAILIMLVCAIVIARAQQPQAPKLNPEAVKALAAIFAEARAENDRHDAVVNGLVQRKADLYSGAGIPLSELNRPIEKIEANGTVIFQPRPRPSPSPTPKASPSP